MALIEKIRNRQGLLLFMIGLGMVGFLIPYDAVMSILGQGANQSVGSVAGNSISAIEYQNAMQQRRGLFNYQNDQALENEVWNDMVESNLLGSDYRELGLQVVQEEFDEIRFGEHISPFVQRTFYQGGVTEEARNNWRETFATMYNDYQSGANANYQGYSDVIVNKRLREKYDALVNKGFYANNLEAKYEYVRGLEKVNIDYVLVKYADIPDSVVTVSDNAVRALYNKRKEDADLKQLEGRNIEYIQFTVEPSQEDIDAIRQELEMIAEEWRTLQNDTAFVLEKTGQTDYVSQTLKETEVVSDRDKEVFESEEGSILGPYEDGGMMVLLKVAGFNEVPDSTVKCRHILLSFKDKGSEEEIETLNARADSLRRRLRRGDDFEDLVTRFSDDPGSKNSGGVYDFFPRGQMVKPFEDFCFDNSVGTIGAVETTYGIHLIEVLDQRWKVNEASLVVVARDLSPTADTRKRVYSEASNFSITFSDYESFKISADTMGYALTEVKDIRKGASSVGSLRDAFEVVNFAYSTEKEEISTPLTVGNDYVVAVVTKIMEAGVPPFENVEDKMREEALKEAKAKYYTEILAKAENLEEAAELGNTAVRNGRGITLKSGTIPGSGVGQEPKVAGLAFAIPEGSMSLPIEGEQGIWVIAPTSEVTPADEKDNYYTEQDQVTSRMRGGLATRLFNAMKEDAKVKDERRSF